jgi:hypothetical protein
MKDILWEEKNLTEPSKKLKSNPTIAQNNTINETKINATKKQWRDIGIKSGIYKIVNKINGHWYVGSSLDVYTRFRQHKRRLKKNIHENPKLQSAFNKYGIDNFEFVFFEPTTNLLGIEQTYLNICKLNPKTSYNLNYNAESPRLGIKHTHKTKRKMSESQMDKTVYTFLNVKTNEKFIGKRYDFYTKFPIKPQNIYALITGKLKHCKGWVIILQEKVGIDQYNI